MKPDRLLAHRPGLTIVEVVVATMLLGTAVLTTLSVQAAITRMSGDAHQRRLLAVAAQAVLDSLRAIPCRTVMAGSAATPRGLLAWSASPGAGNVLTLTLLAAPPRSPAWRAETIVPCP